MRGLVRLRDICMACEKEVCTKGHEMEVSEGHMHGYFSEEELESRFGTLVSGVRFAVCGMAER